MKILLYKILASLFLLLATIYSPFVPYGAIADGHKDTHKITIGLSLPLTGTYEKLGKQMVLGAQLAVQDFKQANQLLNIQLQIEDDTCNDLGGTIAAEKFLKAKVDIATGYLCYKSFQAAQEILKAQNIPSLSASLRHPHHKEHRLKQAWNSFTFGGNLQDDVTTSANILLKHLEQKPYALIDEGSIAARNFIDSIRTIADERGITPIHVDNFRPLQPAQSALIRRLKKSGIKAAFIAGDARDIAIITRDAAQQGLAIEIIGTGDLSILPFISERELIPSYANNLYAIMQDDILSRPNSQKVIKRLAEKSIEVEDFHLLGYAMMQIALTASLEENPKNALERKNFATILDNIQFDGNGEANPLKLSLKQWQNGRFIDVTTHNN